MSARPAAQRMAAAQSILPKVSGEVKAVLPKPFSLARPTAQAAQDIPPTSLNAEKVFLLHHSPTPDIGIGGSIRTTREDTVQQATAGDAILGHSYAWDAKTGLRQSVINQVSGQGRRTYCLFDFCR